MPPAPIDLAVAGQTYRVSADLPAGELRHLASVVDARLASLAVPPRLNPQQRLLYAALALAADLQEERQRHHQTQKHARESLHNLLSRIDEALDATDGAFPAHAPIAPLPEL